VTEGLGEGEGEGEDLHVARRAVQISSRAAQDGELAR